MTHSRRIGAGLLVAGLVLLMTPVAVWAASDSSGADLTSFNLGAGASGVAAYLTPVQGDVAGVLAPETKTTFGSGGSHALAAMPWFGDLASNAGSLANLAASAACNNQCAPLNYPVRAEASSGGAQETSTGPLSATVKDGAKAVAELANLSAPGLVSAARVSSMSRSFFEGGKAVAIGDTTMSGVNIASGAVKIDSLEATAKVTTDGNNTTREHSLVVQGMEIGGQKASIENGKVVIAGQPTDNPLNPVTGPLNEGAGPHVLVTKPIDDADKDGTARVDSGALAIYWDTAGDQSAIFVVSLGGANASAQATPGFDVPGVADAGAPTESAATASLPAAVASLSPGSPAFDNAVTPEATPPRASTGSGRGGGNAPVALGEERASFTKGVSPALLILALIGAVIAGAGLRKLQTGAPVAARCVNDRRRA